MSDARMAEVLRGLELLSHGSTQAWNASGGHSDDPSGRIVTTVLQGDEPPHIAYRRRYQGAGQRGKLQVLEEAEAELKAWKKREKPPEASISEEAVILADFVGYTPEQVAEIRRVLPRFVRDTRQKAGLGTEDGKPVVVSDDRASQAREMCRRGLSTRQIAASLGCHQTQVMRWLRNASGAGI